MATFTDAIEGRRVDGHRPWPRFVVNEDGWRLVADRLSRGECTLLGLWADTPAVHMAVLDGSEIAVVTIECPHARFPSVGLGQPESVA